jgi:hypothetical protein
VRSTVKLICAPAPRPQVTTRFDGIFSPSNGFGGLAQISSRIRQNRQSFSGDTLVLHNNRLMHTTEVGRSNLTTSTVVNGYMIAAGYDYFMPGISDTYLNPIQLAQISYGLNGSTPLKFLGANFVPRGGLFNSTNFAKSVVRTLTNGVKIGILGIFEESKLYHVFIRSFHSIRPDIENIHRQLEQIAWCVGATCDAYITIRPSVVDVPIEIANLKAQNVSFILAMTSARIATAQSWSLLYPDINLFLVENAGSPYVFSAVSGVLIHPY